MFADLNIGIHESTYHSTLGPLWAADVPMNKNTKSILLIEASKSNENQALLLAWRFTRRSRTRQQAPRGSAQSHPRNSKSKGNLPTHNVRYSQQGIRHLEAHPPSEQLDGHTPTHKYDLTIRTIEYRSTAVFHCSGEARRRIGLHNSWNS